MRLELLELLEQVLVQLLADKVVTQHFHLAAKSSRRMAVVVALAQHLAASISLAAVVAQG